MKFRALLLGVSLASIAAVAEATPIQVGADLPFDVLSDAQLAALPAKLHLSVTRIGVAAPGDAPPLRFTGQSGTCASHSLVNDGGSCRDASDGNSWKASYDGPMDAAEFGKTYPLNLYGAVGGSDTGSKCLDVAHPCTAQGALSEVFEFDAKHQPPTINLAAGTYDTSLFAAGFVPGFPASFGSANGAFIKISGAGSPKTTGTPTIINPTTGGGGCAQHFGDGITLSNHAVFMLANLKIGTACPGRASAFLQNGAYLVEGPDLQWTASTGSASMVHVEALAYFEIPGSNPFNIAGGTVTGAAISFASGGLFNFDQGSNINLDGNATFTEGFFFGSDVGIGQLLAGTTVSLNGHTVTGPQYSLNGFAVLLNEANITIPGDANSGVASNAAFYWNDVTGEKHFGAVGSASGNGSGPTIATTNLQLYGVSQTNFAGFMATTAGDICAVAGVTSPACLFNVMHDGGLVAPWSVTGGDKGPGTLNIAGPYYDSGNAGVDCSGTPTSSFASKGGLVTHC